MSGFLAFLALCVSFGWFYDESKLTTQEQNIAIMVFFGLAFIAWCVEQIRDGIKEGLIEAADRRAQADSNRKGSS